MKLVLVADTFPPLRTSGAVQLRDLTREFVRRGHALTVLIPNPELDAAFSLEEFDGARVVRLKAPQTKNVGFVRRTIGEWLMPHAMSHGLQRSPLALERWDGVVWYSPSIFHAPLIRVLKQKSRCKGYLILRDIFPEWAVDIGLMQPGLAFRVFKRIARQQYEVADIIGVQSPGNLSFFDTWRRAREGRSLEVLQNWLDTPSRLYCRIRIHETPLAGRKVFVYAGNMGIAQGMDILIDLAARMRSRRDVGFLFVGRGSETERLKGAAQGLGLDNVLFQGEIDPDEISDLYAQCFAGIVSLDPRHRSHNIPGKFLTYMQNGLPVLANVNPGNDLAALIRQENVGEVCETNSPEALEKRCTALIDAVDADPQFAERCSSLFDREFSVSRAVTQVVDALRKDT